MIGSFALALSVLESNIVAGIICDIISGKDPVTVILPPKQSVYNKKKEQDLQSSDALLFDLKQ